jgi:hypothetical protein
MKRNMLRHKNHVIIIIVCFQYLVWDKYQLTQFIGFRIKSIYLLFQNYFGIVENFILFFKFLR